MKPFSKYKVQINTKQIHSVSILKKQPTILKITSIHFQNIITFFYNFSISQISLPTVFPRAHAPSNWPNARAAWPINCWGLHWWLAVWKHLRNSNTHFKECWKDDKQVSLSCPCACGAMPFEHHRCTGQGKHRDHTSICWWSPRCSPGSDSERLSNTKSCQLLQSSNTTFYSWLWTRHVSITHTQKNTTNQVEALHKSGPQQKQLGWCIWPLVLAALELHCWPRWCKTLQLRCLRVRPCMVAQALRNIFS